MEILITAILLILYFISIGVMIYTSLKNINLKKEVNIQQQTYNKNLINQKKQLQSNISQLTKEKQELLSTLLQKQKNYDKQLQDYKQKQLHKMQTLINLENQRLQNILAEIKENQNKSIMQAEKEKQEINNEINKLKSSLSAGVEAKLREKQKQEKLDFYRLSIGINDVLDIQKLEQLKKSFNKPVVISKLIWSQYIQKNMTELCDRVLGKREICGIYKITNIITEQCYIGQSLNIANRFKQHCKCGLGIEAPSSNTLYNAMQKDKVWNFTFELLEECPRNLLNEKERFWIQMYQSNKFGNYNSTKGNL